jgi:hypothetical protein
VTAHVVLYGLREFRSDTSDAGIRASTGGGMVAADETARAEQTLS